MCDGTRRCKCEACAFADAANVRRNKRVYACQLKVIFPLTSQHTLSNCVELLEDFGKIPVSAAWPSHDEIDRVARSFL